LYHRFDDSLVHRLSCDKDNYNIFHCCIFLSNMVDLMLCRCHYAVQKTIETRKRSQLIHNSLTGEDSVKVYHLSGECKCIIMLIAVFLHTQVRKLRSSSLHIIGRKK
jgi:hypothetical protein